jgi:hypothetical protein
MGSKKNTHTHIYMNYTKTLLLKLYKKTTCFSISTIKSTTPRDDESQLGKDLLLVKPQFTIQRSFKISELLWSFMGFIVKMKTEIKRSDKQKMPKIFPALSAWIFSRIIIFYLILNTADFTSSPWKHNYVF